MGRYFSLYGLGGSVGGPGTLECPLTNMRYNAPAKGAGEGSQTFRAWIAQLVIRPVPPVGENAGAGGGVLRAYRRSRRDSPRRLVGAGA